MPDETKTGTPVPEKLFDRLAADTMPWARWKIPGAGSFTVSYGSGYMADFAAGELDAGKASAALDIQGNPCAVTLGNFIVKILPAVPREPMDQGGISGLLDRVRQLDAIMPVLQSLADEAFPPDRRLRAKPAAIREAMAAERELEEKLKSVQEGIIAGIAEKIGSTDIPGVTRLGKNAVSVKSGSLSADNWSPEYYDADAQARTVRAELAKATTLRGMADRIARLLEGPGKKNLHPAVREVLSGALADMS